MGSLCGSGTNTITQNSGPPAQVLQNYQNLVNQATGTAAGLTGLSGPPVAGWNNELSSALANINQAGDAVNYFNSGLGALSTGMGTVGGALNYLPSEISGIGAAQGMIPGAQGLVGAGASTMSGALPYYGAAGSTISGALPMYGAAAGTEMSALPYYNQGASTLGGALSSYGTGLGTLGSATPYFGAGAGLVGQSTANPFTSGSISQYMSPYINNVVNSTEQQFNNQNAIQANNLTSSAIMGGNAFGGDRAGVAQGVLAGQQQAAEAPVIAGLYNSGYQTAGQEAAQQQGLLQSAGGLMGSLGAGLGGIGAEYGSLGAGMTGAAQAYGSLGSGIAGVGQGLGSLASGEVGAGSALGSVGAGIAGVGSGLGSLGGISGGLAGEAGSLAGMYGSAAGVQGGLGATQAGIGSQISALGPAWASTLEGLGGSQLTGGSAIQNWEQQNLSSGYQGLLNQLGVTGTQFLAPIVEGTGSLSGGTGTTTSPPPSMIGQLGSLGLAGLGLNSVTGGGLASGLSSGLGSIGSYLSGFGASGEAALANAGADLTGIVASSGGTDALAAALAAPIVGKHGGRIGYDDGGSVDDSSGNNDPSGGLGGIVGYNALARELGAGAGADQLAAGLEEGVGFADGGAPNLPTGQPLNMSALLQGSGAGIPGQYGMTFQRGPGPPGLHMGMGPPQPPGMAAPDNGLNNLLAQVQQVTRYMRPNQNQSSNRKGGRIAFGGAVNLPGHYADGGSPDIDGEFNDAAGVPSWLAGAQLSSGAPDTPLPTPRPADADAGLLAAVLPQNATPDSGQSGLGSAPSNTGFSPAGLARTIDIESHGDPNARSGRHVGLGQFDPATWSQYGSGDPRNPTDAIAATQRYATANAQRLTPVLGRPPTDGELYLAHQQGPGGAIALLTHPTARAGDLVGDAAIKGNGGDPNAPASAFVDRWTSRFNDSPTSAPPGLSFLSSNSAAPSAGLGSVAPANASIGKPDLGLALLAAGFSGMASRSPFALSVLGEAGLGGLQNYQQQKVELREEASQQLAAQRLAQEAAYQQGVLKNQTATTAIAQQQADRQQQAMQRQYKLDYYKMQTTPVTVQGPFGSQTAFRQPNGDLVDSQGNVIQHGEPMPGYEPTGGVAAPASGAPQPPSKAALGIYSSLGDDGQALQKNNVPVGMEATNKGAMDAYKLGLHGEAMASAIPPQARAIIQSVANYQMPLTELSAAQSRYNMSMSRGQAMMWVKAINPDFNESIAKNIPTELKGFMEGGPSAPATVLNALRTAEGHAGEMSDALEEMRIAPGGDKLMQQIANYTQTNNVPFASAAAQMLSNASIKGTAAGTALAKFETASTLYATEVARAYAGRGPTDTGREEVLAPFSNKRSYQELTTALHTSVNMLDSKNQAVRDQYDTITKDAPGLAKYGPKDQSNMWPQLKYVNEKGQSSIDKINQRYSSANPNLAAADKNLAAGKTPQQSSGPQEGDRKQFKQGWGVFHNGQWGPAP